MPAAAVTPAPVAYIKVAAVKKLVVEFLFVRVEALQLRFLRTSVCKHTFGLHWLAM